MSACACCASSGVAVDAGADRPHRLVREHEPLVRAARVADRLDLDAQHGLRVAGVALLLRLADAGDDAEARLERRLRASRDARVGLAEVLPPLRVADDRAVDAELEQHRRRDLAGVRALGLPVHVLRVRREAGLDARVQRGVRRRDDRVDAVDAGEPRGERRGSGPRNIFQLPATITARILRVAGIAATPGSSLPSSSSRLAPPPVETHEIFSARPSSFSARTESAPPTTENARSFAATASATAFVPSAKRGHSKTPIGPFQKIVRAPAIAPAKRSRDSGPMSRPSQPSGSPSNG